MNLAELIKPIAGTLGTALAGPFGGVAASFLADKLGIEEKTIKAVTDVFQDSKLTPEQVVNVKAADIQFKEFCMKHEIDLETLVVENTKDARDMQKQTKSYFPATLSSIVTVGFFGILLTMLVWKYQPTEPLLIMLGALGAAFGSVVNFWLGSSSNGQRKTELLAQAQPVGK